MATLTGANIARVYSNDASDRTCLYRVSNVTYQDTVDLGPGGVATDFQVVKMAAFVATTANQVYNIPCAVSNGTVVQIPAGLNNDAGYLLVWGDTD